MPFSSENVETGPKNGDFLGENRGLNVKLWFRNPQKAHPCAEPRRLTYFAWKNGCGDIAILRFFKMAAAAILNFWKFNFLTASLLGRPILHNSAKFHRDRSMHCWDMAIFRFFKMAAVSHLGFWKVWILKLGRPRSAHTCHHTKFPQNQSNGCGDIAI